MREPGSLLKQHPSGGWGKGGWGKGGWGGEGAWDCSSNSNLGGGGEEGGGGVPWRGEEQELPRMCRPTPALHNIPRMDVPQISPYLNRHSLSPDEAREGEPPVILLLQQEAAAQPRSICLCLQCTLYNKCGNCVDTATPHMPLPPRHPVKQVWKLCGHSHTEYARAARTP